MKKLHSLAVSGYETYPNRFSVKFYEFWPEQMFSGWSGARFPSSPPSKNCPTKNHVSWKICIPWPSRALTPIPMVSPWNFMNFGQNKSSVDGLAKIHKKSRRKNWDRFQSPRRSRNQNFSLNFLSFLGGSPPARYLYTFHIYPLKDR